MTSSIVLDSSILIEYTKQNRIDLLDHLLKTLPGSLYINSIVLSEYLYHWLGNNGQRSPRSLQNSQQIPIMLAENPQHDFLALFTVLPLDDRIVPLYLDLMQHYNLLPNDALIIATAKLHQIPAVASFDADFVAACAGEDIRLVSDVADLA